MTARILTPLARPILLGRHDYFRARRISALMERVEDVTAAKIPKKVLTTFCWS